jgi:hypothetical protein
MIVEIDYTNWKGIRSIRRIQPLGTMKFESSEWHPDKQWVVEALDLEKNEHRAYAMKDIHSWRPIEQGSASMMELAIQWYRGGDTGVSSETIFEVMTGVPVQRRGIPWDPADFGRCYRLLQVFPGWRARLQEVATLHAEWQPFVDNWAKMEELYERDLPTDRSKDLYNMMITLRDTWLKKVRGK